MIPQPPRASLCAFSTAPKNYCRRIRSSGTRAASPAPANSSSPKRRSLSPTASMTWRWRFCASIATRPPLAQTNVATDTMAYVATDQSGLTSTSTRTVTVEAPPSSLRPTPQHQPLPPRRPPKQPLPLNSDGFAAAVRNPPYPLSGARHRGSIHRRLRHRQFPAIRQTRANQVRADKLWWPTTAS
jgi:hypothetical protein